MAKLDDGDFGDFKFAPSNPNPTSASNQISDWSFPATDNDDEWGDFFSHSPSKTLPSSQSLPVFPDAFAAPPPGNGWSTRQGALPLSIFGEEDDQSAAADFSLAGDASPFTPKTANSMRKSSSVNAGVPLNDLIGNLYDQSNQIKPHNAPDSFFGDASPLPPKTGDSLRKTSSLDVGVGLNAFVEDSYDESHRIKSPNGLNSNLNSNGVDLKTNEPITATVDSSLGDASFLLPKDSSYLRKTSSAGVELNDLFADSYDKSPQIKPQDELNLKRTTSTGEDANVSAFKVSNSMRKASSFNEVDELNDLMGNLYDQSHLRNGLNSNSNGSGLKTIQSTFETVNSMRKASSLNAGEGMGLNDLIAQLYDQSNRLNPQNGPDKKMAESSPEVNGQSIGGNSDLNGLNQEAVDGNENDDDDGWEFKVAGPETETGARDGTSVMKVEGNGQQSFGRAENTYNMGNDTCTDDLFGTQPVTSNKSGEWDFGFDFNPNFATQDGINSSYAKNKSDDSANGNDWCPSGDKLDSDEFIWEFKNAGSEVGSTHKKEPKVADILPAGQALSVGNSTHDSNGSIDASDMASHGALDFEFSFKPSSTEGGLDSYKSNQNDISNELISSSVDSNVKYDGNLLGFDDSVPETGSKHQSIVDDKQKLRENEFDSIPFSSQNVGDDYGENSWEFQGVNSRITAEDQNSQNSGVDSSTFNYQKDGDDLGQNSWEFKDVSLGTKAEDQASENGMQKHLGDGSDPDKTMFSSVSVNDDDDFGVDSWEFMGALSAEPSSAKERSYNSDEHKLCENVSEFTSVASQPTIVNSDGIPWDLKDVSSGSKVEDKFSDPGCEDLYNGNPTILEVDKYLDLYRKLKDELCCITTYHLDNLKKKQSNDALSSEDADDKAPCDDIQEIYNELQQENIELHSEDILEINSCLNELLEALKEPVFQMIESEYHISERLSAAAKDLRPAIELLKHVVLTLKILELGSAEEQFSYVSTWHRIISVCAEELEHGASIWNQSLQKNVHNHILSGPQGKSYILGLGEIYRVVEVVGASTKLYKPWVLSYSADPTALFDLVNKCYALWSSSGIEEAVNSLSDPIEFRYDGTISELQASIKAINDLDEHTLKKHVLPTHEPICRLSLLSPDSALGLKLVVWDEEHYFLKVANLWANLVSHDPPNLPRMQVG